MGVPVTLDVTGSGATLTFGVEGRTEIVSTEVALAELQDDGEQNEEKQRKLIRAINFIKHYDGIKK